MYSIHKLAKMFEELAEHKSKITGEQAGKINNSLMFERGVDGVFRVLEKEKLRLGPKEDKDTYFILDSNGGFVINAFVEVVFDHGSKTNSYKVRPKDMRGLIKDYEVKSDDKKNSQFMNSMEAYHRWDDDGLD